MKSSFKLILASTVVALILIVSGDVMAQDDSRCYTVENFAQNLSIDIGWEKVPVHGPRRRFRAGQTVNTPNPKCIVAMDNVKISIRNGMTYRNLAYTGNVYDGNHIALIFRDKESNQVVKRVAVSDGSAIDWPRNTFMSVDFQFPSFPAGLDPRRNRFAGSTLKALIYRTNP